MRVTMTVDPPQFDPICTIGAHISCIFVCFGFRKPLTCSLLANLRFDLLVLVFPEYDLSLFLFVFIYFILRATTQQGSGELKDRA